MNSQKANLRKHAADRGLHKVGGGDDHLRDEEQPGIAVILREIRVYLVGIRATSV